MANNGRPRNNAVVLVVRVPKELRDATRKLANKHNIPMSMVVRDALNALLAEATK